jgi:hypothetical protein
VRIEFRTGNRSPSNASPKLLAEGPPFPSKSRPLARETARRMPRAGGWILVGYDLFLKITTGLD